MNLVIETIYSYLGLVEMSYDMLSNITIVIGVIFLIIALYLLINTWWLQVGINKLKKDCRAEFMKYKNKKVFKIEKPSYLVKCPKCNRDIVFINEEVKECLECKTIWITDYLKERLIT